MSDLKWYPGKWYPKELHSIKNMEDIVVFLASKVYYSESSVSKKETQLIRQSF